MPGTTSSTRLPPTDIYYPNIFDKSVKQKAVFGELTYELTEKWSVTGGARWFEYNRHEVDISYVPAGMPVWDPDAGPIDPDDGEPTGQFVGGRIESSGTDSDTVFKFATQYKFDDDRMVYLLYSEGFRLGGNNAARAAATGLVPLEFKPDKLQNYEAGLKSTGSRTACSSMSRRSSCSGTTSRSTATVRAKRPSGCAASSTAARRSRRASRSTVSGT